MKLFIVHGWTSDTKKYRPFLEELRELGHKPVLLKVPGLTTPRADVWDLDKYVNWLRGEIKGEANPVLVCHSNGGRICMKYAQNNSSKIKHLVLIDPAGLVHTELSIEFLRKLFFKGTKFIKRIIGNKHIRRVSSKATAASENINFSPNMKKTMKNMIEADKTIKPDKITTKTTIIWGKNDKTTPYKDAHRLEKLIKNSKLHVISDGRHSPHITHPKQVATIIDKSLTK